MTHGTWQIDQQQFCRWKLKIFWHFKNFGDFRQNPYSEIWVHKRVQDGNPYSFMYSNWPELGSISVTHMVCRWMKMTMWILLQNWFQLFYSFQKSEFAIKECKSGCLLIRKLHLTWQAKLSLSLIKISSDQNSWKNSIPSVFPTFFLKNSDYKKIDSYSNFSVAVSPF